MLNDKLICRYKIRKLKLYPFDIIILCIRCYNIQISSFECKKMALMNWYVIIVGT